MKRARWTWAIIGAAFAVIIVSWILGIMSFANLASPWFNPRGEIRAIRARTPRLYDTGDRSTQLYDYGERAALSIRKVELDKAREIIRKASAEDPANPLFDYLLARAEAADNNPDKAMVYIRKGNAKGGLVIYASNHIRPDKWNRLEVQEVSRLVREMVKIKKDPQSLLALFDLGQKMVLCQPADFSVVSYGLFLRRFVAGHILTEGAGTLTPEAVEFFTRASTHTGPAWTLYEGGDRGNLSDPRNRMFIAMRMMRRGSMKDFVEALTLNKDLEAQATSRYIQRRVKLRPRNVFDRPPAEGEGL